MGTTRIEGGLGPRRARALILEAFLLNDRQLRERWTGGDPQLAHAAVEASLRRSATRLPPEVLVDYVAAIVGGADYAVRVS